ncbi:MAG: homoserine dehydrogenase [Pyrinomonadaceae bacterium]|nr:homoserine dehydrogenase [Pyrinomonadaceae bacterium]
MKTFNLCFLGFGNVGHALVRLLGEKSAEMREEYGIEWRITGMATRRAGWIASAEGLASESLLSAEFAAGSSSSQSRIGVSPPTNVREWLEAARCDVMFEITSLEPLTGQPAVEHVRAALESGAHVVTANKGTIVHAYRELRALALSRGRHFLFDATVADMPVFSLFRECLPAVRLQAFRGIFNSTTGVILEEMERGRTFADGVRRAQTLGVTETDPAYDVDGWDAAVKTCALANVLMDAPLSLDEIEREGIRGLDAEDVRAARAAGRPYKLVSRAERTAEGRIAARVGAEQIAADDPLAAAGGTSLVINFELDILPGLTLTAHHPDLRSTAYGLLSDFINAVRAET